MSDAKSGSASRLRPSSQRERLWRNNRSHLSPERRIGLLHSYTLSISQRETELQNLPEPRWWQWRLRAQVKQERAELLSRIAGYRATMVNVERGLNCDGGLTWR